MYACHIRSSDEQAGRKQKHWLEADPDVRECLAEVVDVHFRVDRQVLLRNTRTSTAHCMHSLRTHSVSAPCTCPRCMGLYQRGCVSVLAAEKNLKYVDNIGAYQACSVFLKRKIPTLQPHYPRAYIHSMTLRSVMRAPGNQGTLRLHNGKWRVIHNPSSPCRTICGCAAVVPGTGSKQIYIALLLRVGSLYKL